jgi:hypothetical protein
MPRIIGPSYVGLSFGYVSDPSKSFLDLCWCGESLLLHSLFVLNINVQSLKQQPVHHFTKALKRSMNTLKRIMSLKNVLLLFSTTTLVFAGSPLGSGTWTSVSPSFDVQECAGGVVSDNTFTLPTTPDGSTSGSGCSNGHLRAERRFLNDYTSGLHQFGGQFQITSLTGNKIALKQTFNGDTGPYFIMGVTSAGDLYDVEGSGTIASGVAMVGAAVQINTIHDADNQTYTVYVSGEDSFNIAAPGGSFYDKCGAYTSDSGTGAITVVWSDVEFWTQ